MLRTEESLLYCAYAIAVFDLLCAVLFAALSLGLILSHLSWLTIFCVCFGLFWLTLIMLLISGIYRRDSDLVWYWIMFSCFGIFVEFLLIVYAFLSHTTFQSGVVNNSLILCLGLLVETIFAFIIYQFYLAISQCKTRARIHSLADCESSEYTNCRRSCHVLQSRAPTSPYTCGYKSIYRKRQEYY